MILRNAFVISKKCGPRIFLPDVISRSCSSVGAVVDQSQVDVVKTMAQARVPPLGVFFAKDKCFSLETRTDLGKKKLINLIERDLAGCKRHQMYLNLHEIFVLAERLRLLQRTVADLEKCSYLVKENHLYSDKSEIEGNSISLDMVENLRGRFIRILHSHKLFGKLGPLTLPVENIQLMVENLSKTLHSCSEPDSLDDLNVHEEMVKGRHIEFKKMFLSGDPKLREEITLPKGLVYRLIANEKQKYLAITKKKATDERGKAFIPLEILDAYRKNLISLIGMWPALHPLIDDPSWTQTPSDTYTRTLHSNKHQFLFVLRERDRSIRVIHFYDGDRITNICLDASFCEKLVEWKAFSTPIQKTL